MIAVVGTLSDEVTATTCGLLSSRGAEFALIDPAAEFSFDLADGVVSGRFPDHGGRERDWREVGALFLRDMTPIQPSNASAWQRHSALALMADHHHGLVINRTPAAISNMSKPYQSSLIASGGFAVPATLITNVPAQAREFIEQECDGRAIYKSCSDWRSIVQLVNPDDLDRLELVSRCPTMFQRYVPGIDVRVHVIGETVFASEVISDAADYRYAIRDGLAREIHATTIPEEIEQRCRALARSLELTTAGIDLRRTPSGEWVCFEVNTSPAFTFYQAHTGQAIGDALADLLIAADRPAG